MNNADTSIQRVSPALVHQINTAFERMQADLMAEHNEETSVMHQEQLRPLLNLTFNTDFEDDIVTSIDIDCSEI
jgi:hypothetical protein